MPDSTGKITKKKEMKSRKAWEKKEKIYSLLGCCPCQLVEPWHPEKQDLKGLKTQLILMP